jgi:hypothetical protein
MTMTLSTKLKENCMQWTKQFISIGFCLIISQAFFSVGYAKPLITQRTADNIEYITGGIGTGESEQLAEYAKQFSLRLLFSEGQCGRSVIGANVIIYDQHKKVIFQLEQASPQLLVNLAKGQYRVVAEYNGLQQGARFTIKDQTHKKVVLNWKNCVEEDEMGLATPD